AAAGVLGIAHNAELGRQHHPVALALYGPSPEFYISVRTVNIRRIQKIDAEFEGAVDGGERFCVIASTVELRHAHTTQAHGGDGEAAATKLACLHDCHSRGKSRRLPPHRCKPSAED